MGDKIKVLSKTVHKNELIMVCQTERFFKGGKKMKSIFLRVVRREKDGFIWEYSKSLEMTKLCYKEEVKEFLEECRNNTFICNDQRGAFQKENLSLFKIRFSIDFSSTHLK